VTSWFYKPIAGSGQDKPKFHLACHVTSWHDTTRTTCRARHDERVEPCLFRNGGRRRSSNARAYKFSLLCCGFAST